jgi:hypothetical protein
MAIQDGLAALDAVMDKVAEFCEAHGEMAKRIKLPVRHACDLMKARRHLGKRLLKAVRRHGVRGFEKKGLYGLAVKLVCGKDAELKIE